MSESSHKTLFAFLVSLAGHGRTDCYSRFNVRTGKGYLLAEEALNQDVVAAHQSGEQPIAIYLLYGETTRLAALDIDNHGSELDWEEVAKRTLPLVEDLRSRGMKPFVVRSGGGAGIHIWLAWREPQNCRDVRRLLGRIMRKNGFKPGTGGIANGEIEVYPKQDTVLAGKLGNPIALPFSRSSVPLDSELQPRSLNGYTPAAIEELHAPPLAALQSDDLPADDQPRALRYPSPPDVVLKGDESQANAALRHVSANDYDNWIRIGFVLKHSFGENGFQLWDEWSKSSPKYPGESECRKVWDSFEPDGTVGIGSLFYLAQQGGWNGPSEPEIREMNAKYGIVTQGTKTMIVEKQIDPEEDNAFVWISKEVLRDRHRSESVLVSTGKTVEQVPLPVYWLSSSDADHYKRINFNPSLPPGRNGNTYNIWTGFAIRPELGDWSILKEHIAENICDGDADLNEWLLNWLALGVQRPGDVLGTAPVLSGLPGVGKGILAHSYGSLWGRHYTTITQESHVSGRFNAHLFGRRFIFIDEGIWGGNRQDAGTIKTRITEPYIMLEAKGIDPIRIRNRTIYMVASNAASIVPADLADRRWQMFEVSDRRRGDRDYFAALTEQFNAGGREGMLYDLLNRDVAAGPDPRRTIKTAGLFDQILRAQGLEFRYIFQILDDGLLPQPDAPSNGPGVTTVQAMFNETRMTYPGGQYVHKGDFGKRLRAIIPGIKDVQSGWFIDGHGPNATRSRSTRYTFPPLSQCRRAFEAHVGQKVPWSNDLEDWQDGRISDPF